MRFIHMRFWRSRLLEALVTENMKDDIVRACPNIQFGGIIDERGCKESITATTKAGISKLISKTEEIIQLTNHPAMGGIGGANIAFKLYEAMIIPALLHNCESWISLDDSHIKLLQQFQEKFVRRLLQLPSSVPKVFLEYDTGLEPMKWRIAYRKLNILGKIMENAAENITKSIILPDRK